MLRDANTAAIVNALNTLLLMGIHPPLPIIDVQAREIGRCAVDQLLWKTLRRERFTIDMRLEPTLGKPEKRLCQSALHPWLLLASAPPQGIFQNSDPNPK